MAITVNGVEVRLEEVKKEIQVNFDALTKEGQKRVFCENPGKFISDVFASENISLTELIDLSENKISSTGLNEIICYFAHKDIFAEVVLDILKLPYFKLADATRKTLALSTVKQYRIVIAKDKDTSLEILKLRQMFFWSAGEFAREKDDMGLFDEIVMHPNFRLDKDIENEISVFSPERQKRIRERIAELKK